MPTKPAGRRRSVYCRSDDPPPLQLTNRDRRVLELVQDLGLATSTQVHRVVFSPVSQTVCNRRLQKLWHHHFLDRLFQPMVLMTGMTGGLKRSRVYYRLAQKGLSEIGVESPVGSPPSAFFLEHTHQVNEFRTTLQQGLGADSGFSWTTERTIRQRNQKARKEDRALSKRMVLPDGLFSFMVNGQRQFFFVEIDRGTESLWRLKVKANRYIDLHRNGLAGKLHNVPAFRVLFMTTSIGRMMKIRHRVATLGHCQNMFWFSAFEEVVNGKKVENLSVDRILSPIWRKIRDGELHSLAD